MSTASIDLEQMAGLIRAMENASTELESRAGSVRGHLTDVWLSTDELDRLNGVLSWIDGELPGLRRRLALARHVEAQTPGIQTYAQIDESTISTATPEEARERADRAAELIEDFDDGEIPEELLDLLADNATDPYFAQRLAQEVSPEEVSEIILSLSSQRRVMPSMMQSDLEAIEEFDTGYEALLDGLGTTLGMATQNTGDLALDDDYALRWLDAIVEENPAELGQAGALSLVISRGSWSTDFLTTVTEGVYFYERDVDEDHMWQNRSSDGTGQLAGAIDPVHGDDEGAPSGWSEYFDPLAGLLAAVGRNPQAGHYLFGSGEVIDIEADGETAQVNAFMEYLIARRRWPVDDGAGAREAIATAMTPFEGGDVISADIAADAHAVVTMKAEEIEARGDDTNWFSEIGHLVLDGLGLIPVVGEPADAINAVWYAAEGNVIDAGLSGAALIPFLGWGATGGKWTRRALTAQELTILGRLDSFPTGFDNVTMMARADGVELPTFEFSDLAAFNRAANSAHPNARYVFNGVAWETDSLGRPIRVSGSPSGSAAGRAPGVQRGIGHEGIDGDVGFHILADSLGGPTNRLNVVPGNGKPLGDGLANLNQGRYAQMERYLREALGNNQAVQVDIVPRYRPDNTTTRPDSFRVQTWVDGELREFDFANRPG
ncbi:DNA/RNA non-specific endonuclease [Jiangella mangrovi]|uniref:Type VII secretion system protein EssD-like domain-containing protein n=1 Tax=Jiangella mangrovi TaxID=1524084 RepID=A0A7W9GMG5_9ACTN|nr:DUF6571 family protein [Jiangella mangrovi]MBB5786560.1 hypothetical protein [Jiangella mangrovi]